MRNTLKARLLLCCLLLPFASTAKDAIDPNVTLLTDDPNAKARMEMERKLKAFKVQTLNDIQSNEIKLRLKKVEEEAYNYGLEEGLYFRGGAINDILGEHATTLYQIFDFNRFIVNGNILLPTVVIGTRLFDQISDPQLRSVRASYTLDKPARIVPQPPTWRDYLIRQYAEPIEPSRFLLPRSVEEKKAFDAGFIRGWNAGIRQADMIYEQDRIRLQGDIEGHYRFRILAAQNIVSLPVAQSDKYSIYRSDDGRTLYVNDVIMTINSDSDFTNTELWEPFFRRDLSGAANVD